MQPPVYSPLTLGAVLAGVRSLAARDDAATDRLTKELAVEYGASRVVLTDSGTSALALAIRAAAGNRPVALPAYGCYDLATAADTAGVPVVLYDLDPATLGPDWPSAQRALAQGAKAVVAVHLFGIPVDLPRLVALAAASGATVIEDAAMGIGASRAGLIAGAGAPLGVLSFGRGKGVTGGHGGALVVAHGTALQVQAPEADATSIKELVPLLAQWLLARPAFYGIPARLPFLGLGETIYRPVAPARRISNVAVAVLARTRALRERETAIRRHNAERLIAAAKQGGRARIVAIEAGATPGYLRLPLVMQPETRAVTLGPEARALGIMPGYPLSLDALPGFGERVVDRGTGVPGAHALASGLITVPTHSRLAERDLVRLEAWLRR